MSNCVKCGEICKCINLYSPDASIIIKKTTTGYGCDFELSINGEIGENTLEFNNTTRQLCLKNADGAILNCVIIPETPQTLSINGNILTISQGNSVTLPDSPPLVLNSTTLRVVQSGPLNHNVQIEVEPSSDAGNTIVYGSDNKLYARGTDVNITNIPGLSFTKSVSAGLITFTPVLDYDYIASQVCPRCQGAPTCPAVTNIQVTNATTNSLTVGWTASEAGQTYVVRYRPSSGGAWVSLPSTSATSVNITGLQPGTTYAFEIVGTCTNGATNTGTSFGTTLTETCTAPTAVTVTVTNG